MDHERFLALVEWTSGGDREAAEQATRATLQTLAERPSSEEVRDLVEQLPPVLGLRRRRADSVTAMAAEHISTSTPVA